MSNSHFDSLIPDYIQRLEPYVAGKPIWEVQEEFGLTEVVKLASNENSLGPSPRAIAALQASLAEVHRYPDVGGLRLRQALADRHRLSVDNVVLGNGSEGIMSYIMRTFLDRDDEVISADATFVGFMVMARARGIQPVAVPLKDYRFDLDAMADRITERTKIVYLCNPNNPTGTWFTRAELDRFLDRLPPRVLVILDEAYFEFATDQPDFPDSMHYRHDQVITLRTFSKAYGLAGLRIGYGMAHDFLIRNLHKVKLPFEPAIPAQAAGLGALEDDEFLARTQQMNREGLQFYYRHLERLGLEYRPSAANFVMILLDSRDQVQTLFGEMLRRGVIVRPLERFGLPHCARITVGTREENERCVEVLEEVLPRVRSRA